MICECIKCNEKWRYGSNISPMLKEHVWNKILKYYNLKDLSNTFICYKCMEKALGRKLKKSDLVDKIYPFNNEFREWYVFGK